MENEKLQRMRELSAQLRQASKAYYQEDAEMMSNLEYDRLYDELLNLEKETGTVLANSPTVSVGYEAMDALPKERHESPMLSLDKTKSVKDLADFAGPHKILLSWKLDGLTVVLTYRGGSLYKAVTRGNGEVGEVITGNAKTFENVPLQIPYQDELILRGEAVITYPDFDAINAGIEDVDARYKNPRNLCSGSVRQLDPSITKKRHVKFYAFALVKADGVDFHNERSEQLNWLTLQGFDAVEYKKVTADQVEATVAWFAQKIQHYEVPSDGLVALYDDIAYGQSLGRTAKFPRDSIAFKWKDETAQTTLLSIEWSASRTGLINPVAVFDPVELEGSTVSRASVHNLSVMKAMKLGIGDTITVYKANMIIPQIAEDLTASGNLEIPKSCPVCGGKTKIRNANGVETLICTNEKCPAKRLKSFALFVSRDALNIEGLSEATLEKFLGRGFIHTFAELFHLGDHRDEIVAMEGFGQKSFENLIDRIEQARVTTVPRVLYALGIPNIGVSNAKLIGRFFDYDLDKIRSASAKEIAQIEGLGDVIASSVEAYFADFENAQALDDLLKELTLEKPEEESSPQNLSGLTFVVTGAVNQFANRNELKEYIEQRGGKVTGSVTSKTDYLINNDTASNSTKNRKAKELGIPILSEEDFLDFRKGEEDHAD